MSEKEKMLRGENYLASDKELVAERTKAKNICLDFNATRHQEADKRNFFLKILFGKKGEKIHIEPPFFCDYGYNIEVGNNLYINHNCTILDVCKVTIGDNVMIGPNTGIYAAAHPIDVYTRVRKGEEFGKPIKIGNNVWIGGNVCILPGVTIGDNTVIAAGSVVNRDIPANVMAAGNPCEVIKEIKN